MSLGRSEEHRTLELGLDPGTIAYVDSDWLHMAAGGLVPALLCQNSSLSWDGFRATVDSTMPPDRAAALAFLDVAQEAVRAVADVPAEQIDVLGDGFTAGLIRKQLGANRVTPPLAIIDTTAHPIAIADAARRVRPLGRLVLAGAAETIQLDLYPDVHVRGLRVVGVGHLLSSGIAPQVPSWFDEYLDANEPVAIARGEVPGLGSWFRFAG